MTTTRVNRRATSRTYVLVHGAYHGSWCWNRVAPLLRTAGHTVLTPTQTGLADRKHLLSRDITMETFVQDIVALLEAEDLEDVVLVGHSFAGRSISGAADRLPYRIRHLVYLDAGLPMDARSRLDSMPAAQRADRLALSASSDGLSIPPPPASAFGIDDEALQAWVDRRLTPHPFGTETSRLELLHPLGNGLPATYARCVAPPFAAVEASASYAAGLSGWRYVELGAGHDCMLTHPSIVADLLLATP